MAKYKSNTSGKAKRKVNTQQVIFVVLAAIMIISMIASMLVNG